MKIIVSGASGFIGSHLCNELNKGNHEVFKLVRRQPTADDEIFWNPAQAQIDELPEVDAIVNLAAHAIGKRLTAKEKSLVLDSRVEGTNLLARTIAAKPSVTKTFVNASAMGIYGTHGDDQLDEYAAHGNGFLSHVVQEWERAAQPAMDAGVRTVFLRTGLVLGKSGGLLKKLLIPFRLGVGGQLGNGEQWMSWISIQDEVAAIIFAIEHQEVEGAVNLSAPHPVRNKEFTKTLGKALHRPTIFPVPKFALSAIFGNELAGDFVGSIYMVPKKLTETGFKFQHERLEDSIHDILNDG